MSLNFYIRRTSFEWLAETVNGRGTVLSERWIQVSEKILEQFRNNPETIYFASTLWINLFDTYNTPLTSIRRSINTLYNKGLIEREEEKAKCPMYGKKVFQYKLSK